MRLVAASFGLALLSTQAHALPIGSVCTTAVLSAPTTCIETDGGGSLGFTSFTNVAIPQFSAVTSGSIPVKAGSVGGAGASSSVIDVTAAPGSIHALVMAGSDVVTGSLGVARARVLILDNFIVGSTKAGAGTLLPFRITINLNGSFSGNGEASVEFSATNISTTTDTLLVGRSSDTLAFDRSYRVGQQVDFRFTVDVGASAGPTRIGSSADLSHTIRIFADPLTADGFLTSASGYDYRSTAAPTDPGAPVPEPGSAVLAISALAALITARRGKSRDAPLAART